MIWRTIKSITIENFKSFREARLPLAPLTLLIGANASGKSNAIEAMQLLSWLASGRRLGDLIVAIREQELSLRGTLNDFTYQGNETTLGCEVGDLLFSTTLQVNEGGLRILAERLESTKLSGLVPLYDVVEPASIFGNEVQVAYNNFKRGGKKPRITCTDQQAIFTQI